MFTWCVYLGFITRHFAKKRIVWVEVQDNKEGEFKITRNQAKRNLMLVCDKTVDNNNIGDTMFDKYWYIRR